MRWIFRIVILVCPIIKSRKTVLMTQASKENVLLCACVTPRVYECHEFVLRYGALPWMNAPHFALAEKVKLWVF